MRVPLAIALASPSDLTRAGMRALLEGAGLVVSAEAGSAAELVRVPSRPDVWLVEAGLPGDVRQAIEAVTDRDDAPAVIVLADELDPRAALEALAAGACGYLPRTLPPERLPAVLRAVADGEAAVPRKLTRGILDRIGEERRTLTLRDPRGEAVTLTPRESAVLRGLAGGRSSAAVASQLSISPVTVRRHAAAAMRKLGVTTRAEAVALLARQGG